MNKQQLETLRLIRKYLAHPDVQNLPFALPASNPLRVLDALIADTEREHAEPVPPIYGGTNAPLGTGTVKLVIL